MQPWRKGKILIWKLYCLVFNADSTKGGIMKKSIVPTLLTLAVVFFSAQISRAHCEIPCGIYDDPLRITLLFEHITTMEKSMHQIATLEKADHAHANQLVRWVMNKEQHADKFQHIVTQYFMTQRLKFDAKLYDKKLALLHRMLIYAMKCKQSIDLDNIGKLREAVTEFRDLYMSGK